MMVQYVRKWCCEFREGRREVHDELRSDMRKLLKKFEWNVFETLISLPVLS